MSMRRWNNYAVHQANGTPEMEVTQASDTKTGPILVANAAGGSIWYGSTGTWSTADVTFEVSHDGTTWDSLKDATGAAITAISSVADDDILKLPEEVFHFPFMRVVSSATQGTGIFVGVFLKG